MKLRLLTNDKIEPPQSYINVRELWQQSKSLGYYL